jgi:ATP-binding cassette subfamily B protein
MSVGPIRGLHAFKRDEEILKHKVAPGTVRKILRFGRPYCGILLFFLLLVVLDATARVVNPLIYRRLFNNGIMAGNATLVLQLALIAGCVAVVDAGLTFAQRQIATQIGLKIVMDLRTRVFIHIQQMSLAFFTRTRTGALVSRLNGDVSGVRDAFTDILSTAVGNLVTVTLVLGAMFYLSWRLTLAALVVIPAFIIPARFVGRRLQALTKESYDRSAEMNNLMVERFNVAGALISKIFGRPEGKPGRSPRMPAACAISASRYPPIRASFSSDWVWSRRSRSRSSTAGVACWPPARPWTSERWWPSSRT